MNRINVLSLLLFFGSLFSLSAHNLHFHNDGSFKIVQFTDTHISPTNKESQIAINLIAETLKEENPDIAILTGDIVTGNPAKDGWKMVLDVLKQSGTPFCILNGNHDWEQKIDPKELAQLVTSVPNSLNERNEEGILSDIVIEIKGSNNDKAQAILYCMDSHQYSNLKNIGGYAWLNFNQIAWYRSMSDKYAKENSNKPLPALAFFHIPLPEYEKASQTSICAGIKMEHECPADINSGMFTAMLEKGDVMGIFTGHDHDNDYIAKMNGICLGYGRFSGGKTTYIDLQPGARVIALKEKSNSFSTYIRLNDGRIIDRYSSNTNPKRDVTFAVAGDLHFDLLPETDQYYHVRAMNNLEKNFVWGTNNSKFKGDVLKKLDFVAIAGDIFDKALPETHYLYRQRYHKGSSDKTIHYDVYPGYGNHDINPFQKNKKDNLRGRAMNLEYMDSVLTAMLNGGKILNLDKKTLCYSWNVDDIHFVQMHTYAGDDSYAPGSNSLKWLEDDLKEYAPGNTPVVYIQHYGFDKWAIKWWSKDKREHLFDILDRHRLMAFFVGHTHTASLQEYRGHKIYQVNNAWPDSDGNGSFAVARMKGDDFSVCSCRWTDDKGNFEIVGPYYNSFKDYSSWMNDVPDNTMLRQLSIPASHDSGAMLGGDNLQTQDITINEQLYLGIRGFDIRLKADSDNQLRVYHSSVSQNITWNEIIAEYVGFLKKHPSETLIVSLKCEGGDTNRYAKLLSSSLSDKSLSPYILQSFNSNTKLSDCRGKILFIHRDNIGSSFAGVRAIGWKDNATFHITLRDQKGDETTASVQDIYQHKYAGNAPYKLSVTIDNIMKSVNSTNVAGKWHITYASATAIPKDGPLKFAQIVNPAIFHELEGIKGGCGIVFMDFVGKDYSMKAIARIIGTNNHK